jgi:hypothetical protein
MFKIGDLVISTITYADYGIVVRVSHNEVWVDWLNYCNNVAMAYTLNNNLLKKVNG